VVEVETKEAAVFDEFVFFAGAEGAGKGAVVEAVGLEGAGFPCIFDAPQVLGAVLGVAAGDVVEGVLQGDLLVGDGVADGGFEEGEVGFFGKGGLEEETLPGFFSKVEVEFLVDDLQEFLAIFLVEPGGKVEEVAVRDVAGGVVMPSDAVRKACAVWYLFHPDVETLAGVVPGVLNPTAFVSLYVHQGLFWVKVPEDVGIDGGAVVGVADDVLAGEMAVFGEHRPLHLL